MNKLTKKIEDLEKNNQELCIDLGAYQNENENLVKDIEKYWKLEEELGCPMEVVFKGLKEGIVLENGKLYHCSLSFHKRQKYSNEDYILICYENGESVVGVSVKQYKKTWWLKGEKNERNRF